MTQNAGTARIVGALAACALTPLALAQLTAGPTEDAHTHTGVESAWAHLILPGDTQVVSLPWGEATEFPTEVVWKAICSTPAELVTVDDLQAMSDDHAAQFADPQFARIVDNSAPRAGLNLVFVLAASVPAAAVPAFTAAEAYLEGQFTGDTMTVTIPVSFAALSPGVIGGTGSSYGYVDWATTRSILVSGMDSNDTIQNFLPTGTTIPVRYTSSNNATNETRVFFTYANWKANGGTVAGDDASMQFSTNFPFDYDPSNGVTTNTISLQDVIIHETGHALGFTSGIDFRINDIEVLDVFRFQSTDGTADLNPDTTAEFQIRPRLGRYNAPNDSHNFDLITVEYRLSDGSPYQASHFREQTPSIGIMDPAFAYGQTFYPTFLLTTDVTVFDAMGYNR